MDNSMGGQVRLVPGTTADPNMAMGQLSTYDADGNPATLVTEEGGPNLGVITVAGAIGTAAKTTTADAPPVDSLVPIQFTSGNSAASPTVDFADTAAIPILLGGTAPSGAECTLAADGIALFYYDGTSLHQIGVYS
jgi:hypothetical protein